MNYEIIDFHTHPFMDPAHNIASHKDYCGMSMENTKEVFDHLGISKICGSVIRAGGAGESDPWTVIRENNAQALQLRKAYGGFYVPGFHVHPAYVEESVAEIERMHALGVNLIGELVPYYDRWNDHTYASPAFSEILDAAEKYDMVVSFHSQNEDEMDKMVASHPNIRFVAAHPGEYPAFMRHIERAKMSDNYYLDLSGTGLFRYGMLRRAIDDMGLEHILFGSDYPTCNPAMFSGAVLLDPLLTDAEREKVLCGNAKALLGL